MQKELTFTYEGSKYTLAFTRQTVQQLTRQGFNPEQVTEQPAIGVLALFRGAFLVHHRGIKPDLVEKIWDKTVNKQELLGKLMDMYAEPINVLLTDSDEDDEKNVTWEANF